MGTNYYVKSKTCECCGHQPDQLHIGKSSAGWTFSFHATETLRSFAQWKDYLEDKTIVDEYGREVSLEEFIQMINEKVDARFNHTLYCRENHPYTEGIFLDPEGHSFSEYEFS